MPFVQIDVTDEQVSATQKQLLIKGVTNLLEEILQKPPHLTHVIIREIPLENWGVSGLSVPELRKKQQTQ